MYIIFEVDKPHIGYSEFNCPANDNGMKNIVLPCEGVKFSLVEPYGVGIVVDEWESKHWNPFRSGPFHHKGITYVVDKCLFFVSEIFAGAIWILLSESGLKPDDVESLVWETTEDSISTKWQEEKFKFELVGGYNAIATRLVVPVDDDSYLTRLRDKKLLGEWFSHFIYESI